MSSARAAASARRDKLRSAVGSVVESLEQRKLFSGSAEFVAPSGLSANSPSSGDITLSWTDNTTNESGFQIEVHNPHESNFRLLKSVAANTTSTSIPGNLGYDYQVRVRAVRAGVDAYSSPLTIDANPHAPTDASLSIYFDEELYYDATWEGTAAADNGYTLRLSNEFGWNGYYDSAAYSNSTTSTENYAPYEWFQSWELEVVAESTTYGELVSAPALASYPGSMPAPSGVTVAINYVSQTVTVSWDAVSGATHYRVYDCGLDSSEVAYVTSNSATFAFGDKFNSTHYYAVQAWDNSSYPNIEWSAFSEVWGVPPAAPTNLTASLMNDAIRGVIGLVWDNISDNESKFVVEWSHNNTTWTAIETPADKAFTRLPGPKPLGWISGETYSFRVKAADADASSTYATTTLALPRKAPFVCNACMVNGVAYDGKTQAETPVLTSSTSGHSDGLTIDGGNDLARTGEATLAQIDGTNALTVVYSSGDQLYFDWNSSSGKYVGDFGITDTLVLSGSEYILTDARGNQKRFSSSFTNTPSGALSRVTSERDPGGNNFRTVSVNGDGRPTEKRITDSNNVDRESWIYTYFTSGANAGEVQTITQRVKDGSSWVATRILDYTYYDGTTANGKVGQIRTAKLADGSGNAIEQNYYRYYGDSETEGAPGQLKFSLGDESYQKLLAAHSVSNADSLTDAQVDDYADVQLEYDDAGRVASRTVQGAGCSSCTGGQGAYTYTYETSTHADGMNNWKFKKTETLPDGNQNVSYFNYAGQLMLSVFVNATTGDKWGTFHVYDTAGRETMTAAPSAVALPSSLATIETYADLLNKVSGNYQYLSDSAGPINTTEYYSSTTATESTAGGAAGYLQNRKTQRGETGTAILLSATTYIAHDNDTDDADDTLSGGAGDDITIYDVASATQYRDTNGTGAQTTSYTYTWFMDSLQAESKTVTNPIVTNAQNGSNAATSSTMVYDTFGRVIWTKDEGGYIHYNEYHGVNGGLTRVLTNVDTSVVSNEPSGWVTPGDGGLHIATDFVVDDLGRTTKTTDANGNVTYTVYNDIAHEVRTYRGWNATTGLTTGPIEVMREDRARGYTEQFTMSATPSTSGSSGSYVPTGTETIASLESLSRSIYNASAQLVETISYFDFTGTSYSASTVKFGTENTNYYRTEYGYDNRGRQARVKNSNGTWTHTVYDGLGRSLSTWVGTNNTGWSHADPSNGGAGGNNMRKVTENEYDGGGIGDGNLTSITRIPGGSAPDRVSEMYYDWRNRLVASKSAVESSESTSANTHFITYTDYDNLSQAIANYTYDGDNVTITYTGGVPNAPSSLLLRAKTVNEYDELGRVFRTTTYPVNPSTGDVASSGLVSQSWFDNRGQVIKSASSGGATQKMQYDGAGRVTKSFVTNGGLDSSWTDADDVTGDVVLEQVEYDYDANGNIIQTTARQRFHDASSSAIGELGSPSSTGLVAKARVNYATSYYDKLDRLTDSVNVGTNGGSTYTRPGSVPSRSDTVLVTSYAFDAAGRLQDVTDPRGIVARTEYDALGRTTRTIEAYTNGTPTDSSNRITAYTYDGLGKVTTLKAVLPDGPDAGTDHDVQETKYLYGATTSRGDGINSNDVLIAVRYPDKTTGLASSAEQELFTTSAIGETLSKTDRNGNVHTFSYDVTGRMSANAVTTLGSGVDGAVRRITTTYNTQGLVEKITSYDAASGGNVVNEVQRAYNGLGQLTTEYQAHDGAVNTSTSPKVQYGYATVANGSRLTLLTYPNGRQLTYNYAGSVNSAISRLSSLSEGTNGLESYAYLGLSSVVMRMHPQNGVDLTYVGTGTGDAGDQYTGLDRFGRVADHKWTNGSSAVDQYLYAYDRNSNRIGKDNALHAALDEDYTYDNLNRLTAADRNSTAYQNWNLDPLGNSKSVTTSGATENRTHNSQNQLTGKGSSTLAFDANGSTTTDQNGRALVYDAWNRLVEGKNGSTSLIRYEYDGLTRRIEEGSTDQYFSSQWQVLEERNSSGVMTAQNTWSPVYVDALVVRDEPIVSSTGKDSSYTSSNGITVQDMLTLPSGKVLVAGYNGNSFAIGRLNTNGTWDTSFDTDGKVITDLGSLSDYIYAVALQDDGKIVAAGRKGGDTAVVRYNANGTLDTSFDSDGIAVYNIGGSDWATDVAIQTDGKILLAGQNYRLARLTSSGALDTTFDSDGVVAGSSSASVAFRSQDTPGTTDDRIVVVGGTGAGSYAARYNIDGTLDTGFDSDGQLTLPAGMLNAHALTFTNASATASMLIAGRSANHFAVAKLNADGTPDSGFGINGVVLAQQGIGYGVAIQSDGKVVVSGSTGVSRLTAAGAIDSTFASDGSYYSTAYPGDAVTIDGSGGIVIGYGWSSHGTDRVVDGSIAATRRTYALQDANFNVTAITHAAGNVVERYLIDPYGQRTIIDPDFSADADNTSDFAFMHGHQGGKYDSVLTNQTLFRNRVYDVETMRWLQQDPWGYVDGLNVYQHVGGSPLTFVDPSGLVLFAFDGTWNVRQNRTNVRRMYEAYADRDAVRFYYDGIGADSSRPTSKDLVAGALGKGGKAISARAADDLDAYANGPVPDGDTRLGRLDRIDIIGYSRGSAIALDFANAIWSGEGIPIRRGDARSDNRGEPVCFYYKPIIRFVGVFDMVPSFGLSAVNISGQGFNNSNFGWDLKNSGMRIRHFAHARRNDDHRFAFNTQRVQANAEQSWDLDHGQMGSMDVTLNWMLAQARSQDIRFNPIVDPQTRGAHEWDH